MRAHGSGTDWYWKSGRCSECGSMMPERAAELLRTRGTPFASNAWTYGWPDSIELGEGTFYAVHLTELDDSELEDFRRLTGPTLGVVYERDDEGMDYRAYSRGVCASGIVGESRRFPPDWWRTLK